MAALSILCVLSFLPLFSTSLTFAFLVPFWLAWDVSLCTKVNDVANWVFWLCVNVFSWRKRCYEASVPAKKTILYFLKKGKFDLAECIFIFLALFQEVLRLKKKQNDSLVRWFINDAFSYNALRPSTCLFFERVLMRAAYSTEFALSFALSVWCTFLAKNLILSTESYKARSGNYCFARSFRVIVSF